MRAMLLLRAGLFAGLLLCPDLHLLRADDGLPYDQRKDVLYGEAHGAGLLMDVFTPRGATNGLGIVDVVSGAWHSDRAKIRDHTLAQLYTIYCARGYTVFAVRPGSLTRFTVTDMEHHLRAGIRWVKEHAGDFRIDPERLGLTGASAGGHLATLEALTTEPATESKGRRPDATVKAVGVFFPPTDLIEWDKDKEPDPAILGPLLFPGGSTGRTVEEIRAKAREASPVYRVAKPTIPFLLIHGDADPVVPLSHSQKLVEAIRKAGGSAELIVKAGGGHPWLTLPEEVKVMADWFDRHLRPGTQPAAAGASPR